MSIPTYLNMFRRTRHLSDSFGITHYLEVYQGQRDQRCRQKLSLLNVLILCLHHDTAKHGYSGVAKESTGHCNGALLSSVMSVGSVCMRVMDVHVYDIDLVSVIFRSAFVHDT